MKFHTPSFLMGFATATVLAVTGKRLKPIAVELGALGMHFGHLSWGVIERQREHFEDLWAEIEERTRERHRAHTQATDTQATKPVRVEPAARNGSEAQ